MRGTKVFSALLLSVTLANAQQQTTQPSLPSLPSRPATPPRAAAGVVADLGSGDARTVARAAQHAREHLERTFARPAAAALARWRVQDGEHARLVCLHLLDALITLGARVPAGDLVALVDDETCGTAAFVLLAREPRHHEPELFALFRRDWPAFDPQLPTAKDLRTLALGNLLAPQAPPGFAALLLPAVELDVDIRVTDAGESPQDTVRFAAAVRIALVRRRAAAAAAAPAPDTEGWPARPSYQLEPPDLRGEGDEVPMPASSPLGLRVARGGRAGQLEQALFVPLAAGHERPSPALQWLGRAAGLAVPSLPRTVQLADPAVFTELAVRARRQQQVFVDALRRELLARNALTEAEAKPLERRIVLRIGDDRADRTVALPALPETGR
jgi:hypothetical protein